MSQNTKKWETQLKGQGPEERMDRVLLIGEKRALKSGTTKLGTKAVTPGRDQGFGV